MHKIITTIFMLLSFSIYGITVTTPDGEIGELHQVVHISYYMDDEGGEDEVYAHLDSRILLCSYWYDGIYYHKDEQVLIHFSEDRALLTLIKLNKEGTVSGQYQFYQNGTNSYKTF